jgi:hypothetical protein
MSCRLCYHLTPCHELPPSILISMYPTFSLNITILMPPLLTTCPAPITCMTWGTKILLRGKKAACANNQGKKCRIVERKLWTMSQVTMRRTLNLLRTKKASRNPKVPEIPKVLLLTLSRSNNNQGR